MMNGKTFWRRLVWCGLALLVAWAVFSTLVVFPYVWCHWQDEVQILEMARGGIVDRLPGWSMETSMNPRIDAQSWGIYYLGGWILEHAYLMWGHLGPRAVTMTAFAVLSLMLWAFLTIKSGDKFLSAVLALLFFSFPTLQICARGVRADILAMLFTVMALLVLEIRSRSIGGRIAVFIVAGMLYAVSVFAWISAVLLGPVVAWEMFDRLSQEDHNWKSWILPTLAAAFAFMVTSVVILLPFLMRWAETVEVSRMVWEINTNISSTTGRLLWKELVICLLQAPGLLVFGLALLFTKRRFIVLSVGFIVFALVCVKTKVYSTRIAYFIPYALIGASMGVVMLKQRLLRRFAYGLVIVMMFAAYGRTYVARNLADYKTWESRDYSRLRPILEARLGRNISVYADTFKLYYIGRELGWNQYHYMVQWLLPPEELLKKVNCCITDATSEKKGIREHLAKNGFSFSEQIRLPNPDQSSLAARLPMFCKQGELLGPFNVYKRNE